MRAIAAVYLHLYETAVLFMDHFARAKRAKKWLILYRHRSLYINISIIIVIVVRSGGVVNSGSYRKSPRAFSTPRNGKKKNSGIGMCWFQRPRQRNRQEQRERERERESSLSREFSNANTVEMSKQYCRCAHPQWTFFDYRQ
jgi:hypothetical protein